MLSKTSLQLSETLFYSGQSLSGLAGLQPANSTTVASFSDLMRRAPEAEDFYLPVIVGETLPRSGNPLPLLPAPDLSIDDLQLTIEISEEAAIESAPLAFSLLLSNAAAVEGAFVNNAAPVPAELPPAGIQPQAPTLATSVPPNPAQNSLVDKLAASAAVAGSLLTEPAPQAPIRVATSAASLSALQHDADQLAMAIPKRAASPGAFITNTLQPAVEMPLHMPSRSTLGSTLGSQLGSPLDDAGSEKVLKTSNETLTPLTASNVPGFSAAASASAGALQSLLTAASGPIAISTPGAAPVYSAGVDVTTADGNWADTFSDRVLLIAGKQLQRAELRLHPAELGSVQIRISVEDNATSLSFTAQNAVARDAIEQALPRLRELFTDSGLTLGNATVSENGARQHDRDDALGTADAEVDAQSEAATDDAWQDPTARRQLRSANQLIDTFA